MVVVVLVVVVVAGTVVDVVVAGTVVVVVVVAGSAREGRFSDSKSFLHDDNINVASIKNKALPTVRKINAPDLFPSYISEEVQRTWTTYFHFETLVRVLLCPSSHIVNFYQAAGLRKFDQIF